MTAFSLDHIIVLLPHSLLHSLPASLSNNFTITPGGKHSPPVTENKLIIFPDGSYIELIAFIPVAEGEEDQRAAHWWGAKKDGIIDYALTSPSVPSASSSFPPASHDPPIVGGRVRPDGQKVEWVVTFPSSSTFERGSVPFFCHDTTERELRVPLEDEGKTTHSSGALGVKGLTIRVPEEKWGEVLQAYEGIFGSPLTVGEGVTEAVYEAPAVLGVGRATIRLVKGEKGGRVEFDELVVRVEEGIKAEEIREELGRQGRALVVRFEE